MNGLAVVFPALLLLAAVVTQLAAVGVIRRNPIAGIRIRSTRRDDASWLAGHRSAAPVAWIGVAASLPAALGAMFLSGTLALVSSVLVIVTFVATVAVSLVMARRAGSAARPSGPVTS